MNPDQRKAAERLQADLTEIANARAPSAAGFAIAEAAALLRELLAEPQGEPVAWRYREGPTSPRSIGGEPGPWVYEEGPRKPYCAWEGVEYEQLYSAPQQRKPLSAAQADRLYQNITPAQQNDARNCAAFKRLVKLVEAVHGIGEPT